VTWTHDGSAANDLPFMVGANMTGTEKLKLLMNGKSLNQDRSKTSKRNRCHLFNKKAWMIMSTDVYRRWVKRLDDKYTIQNRKVLLFFEKNQLNFN
jgi:DDE superfamily endonuclease